MCPDIFQQSVHCLSGAIEKFIVWMKMFRQKRFIVTHENCKTFLPQTNCITHSTHDKTSVLWSVVRHSMTCFGVLWLMWLLNIVQIQWIYKNWIKAIQPRLHVARGSSHRWGGIFFCVQVICVIMKIVTPCFNRPSLLSRSLVG